MQPRVSVSQITTLSATFADDVRTYADAGLAGIGVWELKLPDGGDAEALDLLAVSGLDSAAAIPLVPSIRRCRCHCSAGPRIRQSGSMRTAGR